MGSGQAQVSDARAAIDQARAGVDQASANRRTAIIQSPIDGIVIDWEFDVGQTVAAAIQAPLLFRIASPLAHVQVQVDVDESDVDGLTPGEPATSEVEAFPDEMFHGNRQATTPGAGGRADGHEHSRSRPRRRHRPRPSSPPSSATPASSTSTTPISGCGPG